MRLILKLLQTTTEKNTFINAIAKKVKMSRLCFFIFCLKINGACRCRLICQESFQHCPLAKSDNLLPIVLCDLKYDVLKMAVIQCYLFWKPNPHIIHHKWFPQLLSLLAHDGIHCSDISYQCCTLFSLKMINQLSCGLEIKNFCLLWSKVYCQHSAPPVTHYAVHCLLRVSLAARIGTRFNLFPQRHQLTPLKAE